MTKHLEDSTAYPVRGHSFTRKKAQTQIVDKTIDIKFIKKRQNHQETFVNNSGTC